MEETDYSLKKEISDARHNIFSNYKLKNVNPSVESEHIISELEDEHNYLIEQLFESIVINNIKSVRNLIESKSLDVKCLVLGWSPLLLAAYERRESIVELLLDSGADINTIDKLSHTQRRAYLETIGLYDVYYDYEVSATDKWRIDLLNYAKLLSITSCRGSTALHYAVLANCAQTVDLLMRRGANPTLTNEKGCKPIDWVMKSETKLRQLLFDYEKLFIRREAQQRMRRLIVGQQNAINTVLAALRRKENGWFDEKSPLVFLFLGSSGVGKTELSKCIADYMRETDGSIEFIRLDMTEYQEKHSISKFIGAPPGYVGHQEGGRLTRALIKCPNAVVLFDEIEKAHNDVLTILLQLFDEGRMTDGNGDTADCRDAVFIMTSNLASDEIGNFAKRIRQVENGHKTVDLVGIGCYRSGTISATKEFKEKVVQTLLKKHFKRDEFLGRIDELVYFWPFSDSELRQLVVNSLDLWADRSKRNHKIVLSWSRRVISYISDQYNRHYGARSIKHAVEREIVSKLALAHESLLIRPGDYVHLTVDNPLKSPNGHYVPSEPKVESKICLQLIDRNSYALRFNVIDLPEDQL